MKIVKLTEICKPKQWKTISAKDILKEGPYPVYGANGKIGFYNKFNHEHETVLIGCRGTCGSVHICEKFSYTTGNAMALDNLSEDVHTKFLFYYLKNRGFNDILTGAVQKQITIFKLDKITIPLPSLSTQKRIAEILDKAQEIIGYNQKTVEKYEELKRSLFLDMFGDPVKNEKGWGIIQIKDFGKVSTGNTPSRADKNNYSSNFIEWIKTDNIKEHEIYLSKAEEFLSESGSKKGRIVDENAVLVACIAGSVQSIGRVSLANRKIAFNQQINAIQPNEEIVHPLFLCYLIKNCRVYIQDKATNGMKRMLSKSNFEKIEMINPPIELQNKFSSLIEEIETQKEQAKQALQKSEELFGSLLQKAFRGELVSSKEEQKRHLIEMMKADEADGLYEM